MCSACHRTLQAEYSVEVNLSRVLKLYEDALSERGLTARAEAKNDWKGYSP